MASVARRANMAGTWAASRRPALPSSLAKERYAPQVIPGSRDNEIGALVSAVESRQILDDLASSLDLASCRILNLSVGGFRLASSSGRQQSGRTGERPGTVRIRATPRQPRL